MVGPGRGSAAGSIVAYALGITDIDPIEYNLLFERFLNPARVSMPDIDIDFCIERRQEVIEYVAQKYGKDHVAQLITFGTLGAKQVVRDVAPRDGDQRTGSGPGGKNDSFCRKNDDFCRLWKNHRACGKNMIPTRKYTNGWIWL